MNFYFYVYKKENQAGLFYSSNDSNQDIVYCDVNNPPLIEVGAC